MENKNTGLSLLGLFREFFSAQNGKDMIPEQDEYMENILEPEKENIEEEKNETHET